MGSVMFDLEIKRDFGVFPLSPVHINKYQFPTSGMCTANRKRGLLAGNVCLCYFLLMAYDLSEKGSSASCDAAHKENRQGPKSCQGRRKMNVRKSRIRRVKNLSRESENKKHF